MQSKTKSDNSNKVQTAKQPPRKLNHGDKLDGKEESTHIPEQTAATQAAPQKLNHGDKLDADDPAPSSSQQQTYTGDRSIPSAEDIRTRAYFLAEERRRKGIDGTAEDDWYNAEKGLSSNEIYSKLKVIPSGEY